MAQSQLHIHGGSEDRTFPEIMDYDLRIFKLHKQQQTEINVFNLFHIYKQYKLTTWLSTCMLAYYEFLLKLCMTQSVFIISKNQL